MLHLEDAFKMSEDIFAGRLEDIWPRQIYSSWSRRLEDFLKTSSKDVCAMQIYSSWSRRFQDVLIIPSEDKDKKSL